MEFRARSMNLGRKKGACPYLWVVVLSYEVEIQCKSNDRYYTHFPLDATVKHCASKAVDQGFPFAT